MMNLSSFTVDAFDFVYPTVPSRLVPSPSSSPLHLSTRQHQRHYYGAGRRRQRHVSSGDNVRLYFHHHVSDITGGAVLSDFAPAAASLFNNMKLPAAVVTAGMISLGFATTFPELPNVFDEDGNPKYSQQLRQQCEKLRRLHIVVALISITSELIVVMWAAVEVNQLTERVFPPSASVWDLIQAECDLAWSAVNSHFVFGIIGFVSMLSLRAYVLLIAAEASSALMSAAMAGTAAALCLMVSIVNRGVEAGGGSGVGYGSTIVDLVIHYIWLLAKTATDFKSPGPLEMAAILFEITSVGFILKVALTGDDKITEKKKEKVLAETIEALEPPLIFQGTLGAMKKDESVVSLKKKPPKLSKMSTTSADIDDTATKEKSYLRQQPSDTFNESEKRSSSKSSFEFDPSMNTGLILASESSIMNDVLSSSPSIMSMQISDDSTNSSSSYS